jgi:hypothetical protein
MDELNLIVATQEPRPSRGGHIHLRYRDAAWNSGQHHVEVRRLQQVNVGLMKMYLSTEFVSDRCSRRDVVKMSVRAEDADGLQPNRFDTKTDSACVKARVYDQT